MPEDLSPYLTPSDDELTWFNTLQHEIVQGSYGISTSGSYAEYVISQLELGRPDVIVEKKKVLVKIYIKFFYTLHNFRYEGTEFRVFDTTTGLEKFIAIMNGYRNFQKAMTQIKGGKSKYNFIELMACPGGCANGAGQIKAENPIQQKKLLETVTNLYNSLNEQVEFNICQNEALQLWRECNPDYEKFVYATYEAARVNDLIEAANAWYLFC